MAIAAFFEEPSHRTVTFLKAGLDRLRDNMELADTRLDLDTRRREDTGIAAPRGFEQTVASMLRCGLR